MEENKVSFFFKQGITNIFIRTYSWINIQLNSPDVVISAFVSRRALHRSHCCCLISCNSWHQNPGSSALFDGLWPSIFLLITFQGFSKAVLVWRLGWQWQGFDLVVFHPHLGCPSLPGMHGASLRWKNPVLGDGAHCPRRRQQVFLIDFFWIPHSFKHQ